MTGVAANEFRQPAMPRGESTSSWESSNGRESRDKKETRDFFDFTSFVFALVEKFLLFFGSADLENPLISLSFYMAASVFGLMDSNSSTIAFITLIICFFCIGLKICGFLATLIISLAKFNSHLDCPRVG